MKLTTEQVLFLISVAGMIGGGILADAGAIFTGIVIFVLSFLIFAGLILKP